MDTLRQNLHVAVQRVKNLEMEQEQFFEDVQDLKNQYDKYVIHNFQSIPTYQLTLLYY